VTAGNRLEYMHVFDPTPDSSSVLRAWLAIQVIDDQLLDPPETVRVELDGSFWQTGQATLNLVFGEITALGLITTDGDTVDVSVSSPTGDFRVVASALRVEFVTVPEPAGTLLVGLGLWASARRAVRERGRPRG